jgi:hypothetical protein
MDDPKALNISHFSQPIRQILSMLLVVVLVVAGAWLIHNQVIGIIETNPLLNGFIAAVFLLGIVTCFWQVWILVQSVSWIEAFVQGAPGHEDAKPPRLLAPLAALLGGRRARMQLSSASANSIQDSVATRIDEARDITRYLTNLLIFLGLLGTFYGLAITVPAVVETIRSLSPQAGETGLEVFGKLMKGLESQLGGMGTAFSSSLLGLAGSLVVGLLELFASHGQNRFYRELEEWLSSITRLGFATGESENTDQGMMAQILDRLSDQVEVLQTLYAQAEANRGSGDDRIGALAAAMDRVATRLEADPAKAQLAAQTAALTRIAEGQAQFAAQTDALTRIAEGQERLVAVLTGPESNASAEAENRMRLRSIDVQLLRILEEMSAGRQESVADLRADLTSLTAAIRTLSRGAVGRG